mgnify:CR=1 FL=1
MTVYVPEEFTPAESDILKRYFTNLDSPVFALVNLPEVVKGALFARYSRSAKSLRRLFLDEFVNELEVQGDVSLDATIGIERAESLYEKIFVEYGDDSVAQLGGVHLACEQASNLLTKILEWGRLMSYLEQSTRYISYDNRLGGRYRFYRDIYDLWYLFNRRHALNSGTKRIAACRVYFAARDGRQNSLIDSAVKCQCTRLIGLHNRHCCTCHGGI